MENELFDLVKRAQGGDNDALQEVISMFAPAIRYARFKTTRDRRDDLEQHITETIIKKIMKYDLMKTPNFSSFCEQLKEFDRHID